MTQSTGDSDGTEPHARRLPSPKERRRLREAKSLSEQQVAEAVGVTRATIRNWETGRTTPRGRKREAYGKLLASLAADREARQAHGDAVAPAGERKTRQDAGEQHDAAPAPSGGATTTGGAEHYRPPALAGTGESRTSEVDPTAPRERAGEHAPGRSEVAEAPAVASSAAGAASGGASAKATLRTPETGPPPTPAPASAPALVPEERSAPLPASPSRLATAPVAERASGPGSRPARGPFPAVGPAASGTHPPPAPPDSRHRRTPTAHYPPAVPQAREPSLTAEQAFDALYARAAPDLVRQAYLLTGRRALAREAVEHAFHLAWQRWPEVAVDRHPEGWVRAAVYEYALSPWHRLRRSHRRPEPNEQASVPASADPERHPLRAALLELPPPYRRTMLLYDGLGLDLPETAAETEASTPAAANRILHARELVAARLPQLSEPAALHRELGDLVRAGVGPDVPPAPTVRDNSERRTQFWTRAAFGLTALIIGATAVTLATSPSHYDPPQAPGEAVSGVPPRGGPPSFTKAEVTLRAKLRSHPNAGPERLVPRVG
ncbi:sigma factor-like helix-turn-helix DNA-binding protein [Streptomyces sp. NPDC059176]|uniref:sigma factor-like helix-turn-helix DNA-binding protein n=1 Tax=unclassified Streptomyces TaxID=2593676 RepID=UPI0036AD61F6